MKKQDRGKIQRRARGVVVGGRCKRDPTQQPQKEMTKMAV